MSLKFYQIKSKRSKLSNHDFGRNILIISNLNNIQLEYFSVFCSVDIND